MNKKTLLTSLLLLFVTIVSFAQNNSSVQYSVPSRNEYLLKDPVWFISVGAGAQVYFGEDDYGAPGNRIGLDRRATFAPTLSFGRRMSNIVALRLQLSGGSLHGFNDGYSGTYTRWGKNGTTSLDKMYDTFDPQWGYMDWVENVDYEYGYVDNVAGGVKVWHPKKWGENGAYYMQHMRYISFAGDVMFNALNLLNGYRPNRTWEILPFLSLGVYQRFAHIGTLTDTFIGGGAGLNITYNFTRNWGVYGEGRGVIVSDLFDGQKVG